MPYLEFKGAGHSSECGNKKIVKNKVLSNDKIIKKVTAVIKYL